MFEAFPLPLIVCGRMNRWTQESVNGRIGSSICARGLGISSLAIEKYGVVEMGTGLIYRFWMRRAFYLYEANCVGGFRARRAYAMI